MASMAMLNNQRVKDFLAEAGDEIILDFEFEKFQVLTWWDLHLR